MNLISDKIKNKQTFRDRLTHKIKALRELQSNNTQKISYVEAQFILNGKLIKEKVIALILTSIYGGQFTKINSDWNHHLKNQKLSEDVLQIKKKVIEQQWLEQNVDEVRLKQKQKRFQDYTGKVQNEKEVKIRLKQLKDQLSILQNQINMARHDQQSLKLTQKYNQLKQQQIFYKNRKRRLKTLAMEKSSLMLQSKSSVIIEMQQKVDKISKQQRIDQYLSKLKKNQNPQKDIKSKAQKVNKKQEGKNRINKLQQLFLTYAKKQCHQSMLFQQMSKAQHCVSMQNFLRMIGETKVDHLLTLQERVIIFKTNSNFDKKINFNSFINALNEIFIKNCEKLGIDFTPINLDMFLDDFVHKVTKHLQSHGLNMNEKKNTANLRQKQQKKYQYKIRNHTGKTIDNIIQELQQRKQAKKERFILLKGKVKGVKKDSVRYIRSKTIKNIQSPSNQYQSINMKRSAYRTAEFENQQQKEKTVVSHVSYKNTYANIFQRRKVLNNSQKYPKDKSSFTNACTTHDPTNSKASYSNIQKYRNKLAPLQPLQVGRKQTLQSENLQQSIIREDLSDIISPQEDIFLTSHIERKSVVVREENNKYKISKFHY